MLRTVLKIKIRNRARKTALGAANTDGTAAVEFALLLPIMITLFFGVVESSMALICRSDVSLMAATAGDLIAQANTASTADLSNIYSAAGTVLYPYYNPAVNGSQKPTIRITAVNDDGSGGATGNKLTGKIAWTCTQAGSSGCTNRFCWERSP
jgi:Flp pilus assembly protein TadG